MDVVKAVVAKFGMPKDEVVKMVRDFYDPVTYPDMSKGSIHHKDFDNEDRPEGNGLYESTEKGEVFPVMTDKTRLADPGSTEDLKSNSSGFLWELKGPNLRKPKVWSVASDRWFEDRNKGTVFPDQASAMKEKPLLGMAAQFGGEINLVKNGLGYEVPITTGTSVVDEKENAGMKDKEVQCPKCGKWQSWEDAYSGGSCIYCDESFDGNWPTRSVKNSDDRVINEADVRNWGYFQTGDFVTYHPTVGKGFDYLVGQVIEVKSPKAKVTFPGKGTDWYYFEDLEASTKNADDSTDPAAFNEDLDRVENPSWMLDENVWAKAKEAAGKGSGDKYWATVTKIYEQMGGRIK
jgi:hypothetical protein